MSAGLIALQGEMDSVASVAQNLSRLDGVQETMSWLRTGIGHVQAAGDAQVLIALIAACRPLEMQARQIADVRVAAGQALQQYADQVSMLQQEARALESRKASEELARAHTANRIANIDCNADDAALQSCRLNDRLGEGDASLRRIEQQLADLDQARLSADRVCAAAIDACAAALAGIGGTQASFGGVQTAAFRRTGYSPAELFRISLMTPEQVAQWWGSLSAAERSHLQRTQSLFIGNLNGVPIEDRFPANAETAKRYAADEGISAEERRYWQQVIDGTVKLVVLDREQHRIVEMLGEIGPNTSQVITYVPGTTTRFRDFYSGKVKRGPEYLVQQLPGSVLFVYRDFPAIGWLTNADEDALAERGQNLAAFDLGVIGLEPHLSGVPQTAIGYSAGMPVVGGSELSGARYDRVISLGGSYVPDEWTAQPGTEYTDIRYVGDLVNIADILGGLNTINGQTEVFEHVRFESPDPEGRSDLRHGRLGGGPEENGPVLQHIRDTLRDNK